MARDIVIPNGNEESFLEMAGKLGYSELVFLYKEGKPRVKALSAGLAGKQGEVPLKKKRFNYVFATAPWALKDKRVCLAYDLETAKKKDTPHQRVSGLNHVLAREAAKNNVKVAFNFNRLLRTKNAVLLGRMMQNAKLCEKYKARIVVASFASKPSEMRAPRELKAFARVLGIHPSNAKNALDWE